MIFNRSSIKLNYFHWLFEKLNWNLNGQNICVLSEAGNDNENVSYGNISSDNISSNFYYQIHKAVFPIVTLSAKNN